MIVDTGRDKHFLQQNRGLPPALIRLRSCRVVFEAYLSGKAGRWNQNQIDASDVVAFYLESFCFSSVGMSTGSEVTPCYLVLTVYHSGKFKCMIRCILAKNQPFGDISGTYLREFQTEACVRRPLRIRNRPADGPSDNTAKNNVDT